MAAAGSRLGGSRRFVSGFVAGAILGAAGAGLAAQRLLRSQGEDSVSRTQKSAEPPAESILEQYGLPALGAEPRHYTNHALSYDQGKRGPRWVLEHISRNKTRGRWSTVTPCSELLHPPRPPPQQRCKSWVRGRRVLGAGGD
uniref:Uncharacterized protein n=1 Tax=Monodelphis domestica TaxID=13616 RepID=A0A5F8GUY1_MONDO